MDKARLGRNPWGLVEDCSDRVIPLPVPMLSQFLDFSSRESQHIVKNKEIEDGKVATFFKEFQAKECHTSLGLLIKHD